jgi:hypothetical protein
MNFFINANHRRCQPTPSHCAMCQHVECHLLILLILLLMTLVACWCMHIYATSPRKAKWSGPHHTIKRLHFVLFHSVTCYTKSIISCIQVNTTKLHNITCALVATGVILRSLECNRLKFKTSGKLTHHLRGIYGMYLRSIKKKTKRSQHACNRLDLVIKTRNLDQLYPKTSLDNDSYFQPFCVCMNPRG